METTFSSFRKDIAKLKNAKREDYSQYLDYEEALDVVRDYLGEKLKSMKTISGEEERKKIVKDKEYLRERLKEYRELIQDIVFGESVRVRGYEGNKIYDFIEEATHEIAGYSVLSDAFNDPEVSDIFVIKWDLIFVEKNGENQKYHKTFRSKEHLKNVLVRLVEEASKELNDGDKKIVDFELYGDRGCAISNKVATKDYSVTFRKHSEDHIRLQNLLDYGVLTEEMAEMLGNIIIGESNLIYAGLTGSGKTTTIRALLDNYVTKTNKRVLVCEDTQELFLENEHTLELVSVKSENPSLEVTQDDLIITSLRLKPKYIVVGEVRGEEARSAVEGMETGHSTIFTMHGGNGWNIVNRLVTKYLMAMPSLGIDVVERIIGSAVDYLCIQDNIPGIGRRLTSIEEVSYDFKTGRVMLKPIFVFNVREEKFEMKNKLSIEKANTMLRRGVKWDDIKQWVEEEE